jgi:hypothetical protein
MIVGWLAGSLWFALFLAANVAVVHWASPERKARINQGLFLAGLAGTAISLWPTAVMLRGTLLGHGGVGMAILWGVLAYIGLFVLYMPFYYTVMASLSVRTMVMLHRRPGNRISIAELREYFVSRALVGQRLVTMATNGFLQARGNDYALRPKGRRIAVAFAWLKRFWRLGAGG